MKKGNYDLIQPKVLDDEEMEKVTGGAMIVNHNMAAINTLTQLSENRGSLSKSLAKLSSGMEINSAADDPSGNQISERMRVQIRSLDQANYNAQNGRSMMKVAEGAVSSTVEILRDLKEKVINAVNDTNSEVDREAIQEELDASVQQIDDNALLTFNGKFLNNGARTCKGQTPTDVMSTEQLSVDTTANVMSTEQLSVNTTADVMFTEQLSVNTTADTKLTDLMDCNGESMGIEETDTVTVSYVQGGQTYTTTFKAEELTLGDLFGNSVTLSELESIINNEDVTNIYIDDRTGNGTDPLDRITVEYLKDGETQTVSNSILRLGLVPSDAENLINEMKEFNDGEFSTGADVDTHDNGEAVSFTAKTGIDTQISAIYIGISDKNGEVKAAATSVLDSFTNSISTRSESGDNSVTLQIDANANQIMNLSLDDMRASALGLSGNGATVSVANKTAATAALKVIDNALQRALNQESSIGAVMNRLEFTSNNLTTSSENLQSAESTYSDADMPKEMTELTKNNILMQAATSMLSQANQQNQGVLSLLQ